MQQFYSTKIVIVLKQLLDAQRRRNLLITIHYSDIVIRFLCFLLENGYIENFVISKKRRVIFVSLIYNDEKRPAITFMHCFNSTNFSFSDLITNKRFRFEKNILYVFYNVRYGFITLNQLMTYCDGGFLIAAIK